MERNYNPQEQYPQGYQPYQVESPQEGTIPEELLKAYTDIDNMRMPIINIRRTSNLAMAPVNFFAIAAGIFMLSTPMMGWVSFRSPVLGVALIFAGACNYILGILDWYQGKTFLCINDFIFAFFHLAIYKSCSLVQYEIGKPWVDRNETENRAMTYSVGVFLALSLFYFIILIICIYRNGIMYIVNYGLLIFATIFGMVWQFNRKAAQSDKNWAEKTTGYFMFFASLTFFYTGVAKLINEVWQKELIPLVEPSI